MATDSNITTIIDTDVGGDPDDAIALVAASIRMPSLKLVLTSDEHNGMRAEFARLLLRNLSRKDVQVVAGADLGNDRYISVHSFGLKGAPESEMDVVTSVAQLCDDHPASVINWIGMGPLTNLRDVLMARPDLGTRLLITQMGGVINYRDPTRAEHNFRLDIDAARYVVTHGPHLRLVMSDVTFTTASEITTDSSFYKRAVALDTSWSKALVQHMNEWFENFHQGTMQHDAITLSAALSLDFVTFEDATVSLDGIGRMQIHANGRRLAVSAFADYERFNAWLNETLEPSLWMRAE